MISVDAKVRYREVRRSMAVLASPERGAAAHNHYQHSRHSAQPGGCLVVIPSTTGNGLSFTPQACTTMNPSGLPRLLRSLATTVGLIILLLQGAGCLFYSLSGSSLSKEAKTFTIQEFQSKVALGPPNLAGQLTQKLREEIVQRTHLKEDVHHGDIQFDGMITKFDYTSILPRSTSDGAVGSRMQLSITVQVNYTNIYDKDFEFSKKDFTQTTDVEAGNEQTEEASMVETVVRKLIQDIFTASIANW